jgi:hypothetical protein
MDNPSQFPVVRVDPAAKEHLDKIIAAYNAAGRSMSYTRFVSDLILAFPIPTPTQALMVTGGIAPSGPEQPGGNKPEEV